MPFKRQAIVGCLGVEEMLGEIQDTGDRHQIRSQISIVVRPGVDQATGLAGENFQDLSERQVKGCSPEKQS